MKNLVSYEQAIGADGGKASAAIGVEGEMLKMEISASYPLAKVIEPACSALDAALVKLEQAIPGDWDKPFIEQIKAEYKAELVKLLAE